MPASPTRGAVMVCGSASGSGKSTVTAGLCRLLARRGASVAPFKAQNMSNHAAVTADGGEVGRAQEMQARAAGVDVTVDMNPILLKPSGERTSHVVVLGREVGSTDAPGWGTRTQELRPVVRAAFDRLRAAHDIVVAEGAGGAAEINLLDRDLVNLPLAAATGMRALLVVDIDRGGAFAAAHGTIDLLPPPLRATIGGIVFNRFRGDPDLLRPGLDELTDRTGVPVLGVLPHLGPDPLLGVEDSLDIPVGPGRAASGDPVRVAAVRLPHLANPSDLDPLATEPDVELRWASRAGDLDGADLIVVPGSRATVADLAWLRDSGFVHAIVDSDAEVIGICAGQQMLGQHLDDGIESRAGRVTGLALLPLHTSFREPKVVRRRTGTADGVPVVGYQIHLGRVAGDGPAWLHLDRPDGDGAEPDGAVSSDGRIRGTSLHGIFDGDALRSDVLSRVARKRGREFAPSPVPFADRLTAQHDRLANWIERGLDVDPLLALVTSAAPPGGGPGWR